METVMATPLTHPQPSFAPGQMLHALAKNWWLILLRGVCAILFGVLTFVWPGVTLVSLVLLFGAFAFADGVFALGAAITGGTATPRWWLAVVGLLGILAGLATIASPGITAVVLQFFIAGWAIASGVMQIIGAIQLRKEIEGEWFLVLAGALWVLFGLTLLLRPGVGALALLYTIGSFAILYGILEIAFAMRLRRHAQA
jgi:uncharacterized membrane protein HdeD (DUF308 family)